MRKTNWIIFSGIVSTLIPHTFASAQAQEPVLDEAYEASLLGEVDPVGFDTNNSLSPTMAEPFQGKIAQTEPTEANTQNTAKDLRVRSRFGLDYNSTGGGSDDFGGVEAFLPIRQSAGQNVTYLNGRLNIDNDANLGSNLLFGHRALAEDRIYGGYVAWDTRDTGSETFNQVGAGFESLGKSFDWRVNGYLPIGNTHRGGSTTPQVSAARFQDNALLLDILNVENTQSALGGVEAEVGTKLADFGNGSDLRGFGGIYYRDGAGVEGSVGGSVRLEASPIEAVNLSAGVQHDGIFGTNVLFRVGVSLPSSATGHAASGSKTDEIYRRIADSVVRNNAIVVEQNISTEQQTAVVAVNPDTGADSAIRHVSPGATGGDGTAASPVGTVAAATALANSGDIIYVQEGNAGPGGFTIPEGVQVRSTGPVQRVATQYGNVQLPGSGTGNLPVIDNAGVTLGNNTVLSGFEVSNATGDAIAGTGIENVTIQDNRTVASLGAGIKLENVSGLVVIENNQLDSSLLDTGVFIDTNSSIAQDLTITNNTVSGNAEQGILINTSGMAQVNADIRNNTLTGNNPGKAGIEVETDTADPGSVCLNLNGNTSDTNYTLTLFPDSQFQVVDLANVDQNNTGNVTRVNTSATRDFVDTAACAQ
ncbi:MAG: right-handed parallel beta-helix repeat-containing protein [Cyanobacteria bacterium J06560_2]